ncbi:MAG TPA: hypothetical protein VHC63_10885 [Acidimicrobiales bacterium]|nr:hypothetical protein [Acidimicrobiales bacterium]
MIKRLVSLAVVVGVLATGPACAKKNEDKLSLQNMLERSEHASGVFRYSDQTPRTPLNPGGLAQVRGLIEDDFRYKARLTVDGTDALDEVVNDDALAVRFLDPSFVSKFTSRTGGDAATRAFLNARYWVLDETGAPSIGDAAVTDRVIGVDPIVDSLSVVDYTLDAISAAAAVKKFSAEDIDYRPLEDPFPQPAKGSGVTRWDLVPPNLPKADALDTGQASAANLARVQNFRKMAIYVKDGKVIQIREQIAAKFDLLNKFNDYIVRLIGKLNKDQLPSVQRQLAQAKKVGPDVLEALLNLSLNQVLVSSGEQPVRFRSMIYEFTGQGTKVHADLPAGPDVKEGALDFFGVNSKITAEKQTTNAGAAGQASATTTTVPDSTATSAP